MKKITLDDIAKATNRSKSTVSRVFTGSGYVREDIKIQIIETAQKMGYKQPKHPSNYIKDMVMVLSCQLDSYPQILLSKGIRHKLESKNIKTVIAPIDFENDEICAYLDYANRKKFGGIISLGALETSGLEQELRLMNCPIVLLNQNFDNLPSANIIMDDYKGSYNATKYLIEQGHQKITFFSGYANASAIKNRELGYIDAINTANLHPRVVYKDFTANSGADFIKDWSNDNNRSSAVIVTTDVLLNGMLKQIKQNNIDIINELNIICFGDTLACQLNNPSISVVDYDFYAMGESMAELLLNQRFKGKKKSITAYFEPNLIIRNSVNIFK